MESNRQNCIASLMTAKTASAISSIQLAGGGAEEILKNIFKPLGQVPSFAIGSILHGNIFDGDKLIDEVIIGCEDKDLFSINCHGNPLIVENILELIKKHGAIITEPQEVLVYLGKQKYGDNTIAIEADIVMAQSATLYGAKIIRYQTKMGLIQAANWWLDNLNALEIDDIIIGSEQVLSDSEIAKFFIRGAKIVIAGPPNSGKSTLFNYLCGKEKAIVTDIAGTTRDWLSAKIRLKNIQAEFFDTAGLDETLSEKNIIDAQSQKQAIELIKNCDLVLYVVDSTNPAKVLAGLTESLKKLVVINKCDLAGDLLADGLKISAKTGSGTKELIDEIEQRLGVIDFDMKKTVCFTDRQENILEQITEAKTKQQIKKLIQELLKGKFAV
ncbi:MAG: GTPase [Sedimentisphaerales bacterium]|jgi:tRNA modification GTPase